jgi:DNA processing protein
MHSELVYQIALTQVPNIGPIHAKILALHYGSASNIFNAKIQHLEKIDGIGKIRAESIKMFDAFTHAQLESDFIEKYKIKPLFITDAQYPKRLLNCSDCPTLLYYRGDADLNAKKIIAIIGTRTNTEYGKLVTEKLVKELANENILVISGLAFGIDTLAHKAALKNKLSTIGVLAHGLDGIYPPENTKLAKQMITDNGGILSEFMTGTKPDRHNFPIRNRIVAGMADATIVIETDLKGGSMITAELAYSYNRALFAFPGKTTDAKSKGSNFLIKNNKAKLITCAEDVIAAMNWHTQPSKKIKTQRELFIELTANEKVVINLLNHNEQLQVDEIYEKSDLNTSLVAAALLNLELQGIVTSLPGKVYKMS